MNKESTHYIECFQHAGIGKRKRIFSECQFIKYTDNGNKAIVKVIKGIRGGEGNIRYVDKNRLIKMYVETI